MSNFGIWIQNVGAAWLMTSLSHSPTLVALVQTATSLPFLVADPGRRLETFLVGSWSEHMRQHARLMEADRATEDEVRAFHLGEGPPVVSHFIVERLRRATKGEWPM